MSFENPLKENIPGYKPLELTYRDGHLWMSNGTRFEPDFPVGSERWQIDLFIEYERTFGRGKAFEITHSPLRPALDPRILKKFYNGIDPSEIQFEWKRIVAQMKRIVVSGTESETKELVEKIKDFRKKYLFLYDDAEKHAEPGHPY